MDPLVLSSVNRGHRIILWAGPGALAGASHRCGTSYGPPGRVYLVSLTPGAESLPTGLVEPVGVLEQNLYIRTNILTYMCMYVLCSNIHLTLANILLTRISVKRIQDFRGHLSMQRASRLGLVRIHSSLPRVERSPRSSEHWGFGTVHQLI